MTGQHSSGCGMGSLSRHVSIHQKVSGYYKTYTGADPYRNENSAIYIVRSFCSSMSKIAVLIPKTLSLVSENVYILGRWCTQH